MTLDGCAILLPAAGRAVRMRGRDKLAESVDRVPALRHAVQVSLKTGAQVAVTLPLQDLSRAALLSGLPVTRISVPDAEEGMAASLRAAARWALTQRLRVLMIHLPDMPDITTGDMRALIDAQADRSGEILRAASARGAPGHPVLLPASILPELLTLQGDTGAKALLQSRKVRLFPLSGRRAVMDLDTPEDWQAWRQRAQSG